MNGIVGKIIGSVLLIGIVFGLFVAVTLPFEIHKKIKAEAWPSRKGTITKSYASRQQGGRGRHGSGWYWRPQICGTYMDNGEKFCVSRIRYGGFRIGEGKASAFETVAKYPIGSEVEIYYSPENSKKTVLEAHSSWKEIFILSGLACGFLLLPFLLWVFRKQIEPDRYQG